MAKKELKTTPNQQQQMLQKDRSLAGYGRWWQLLKTTVKTLDTKTMEQQ